MKLLLICLSLVLSAALALLLGKEAGWDLLNYHWYIPYAWLHQRLDMDVAVAHHATYYNPVLDLPLFLFANGGSAWLAGLVLGGLFGVAVAFTGAIGYQALGSSAFSHYSDQQRLVAASVLALLGAVGGGALSALGNSANDAVAAIGILAALWLQLRGMALRHEQSGAAHRVLIWSGVLAGLSVGLKLTLAIYALGLVAATLVTTPTIKLRLRAMVLLGSGMLLGMLITGGPWQWQMWQYSGNPFFPYFNQLFQSPLLIDASYRDLSYVSGHQGWSRWWFPLTFTLDSLAVAEWTFRDAKLLLAYVLVPIAAALMWLRSAVTLPSQSAIFLFVFAGVSYVTWLWMFGVYRYLIPLEMLAPLLIILAIAQWPGSTKLRIASAAVILIGAQCVVQWNVPRLAWQGAYVGVSVPPLPQPQHTMILMAGNAPMAYVIPSFPAEIPFLRIDGWLVGAEDRRSGLALRMRERVAKHQGPLLMMYAPYEAQQAAKAAQAYGLKLREQCVAVASNVADALMLCELVRV